MHMLTHNHAMHYYSWAFIEGYEFVPKYTPHSKSSRVKLLGFSSYVYHFLIRPLQGPSISHFSFLFIFAIFRVFSFSFSFHTTISSKKKKFSSHNHDAYGLQSNHILTSTISQNITLFTPIMFHNFQEFTQLFFLHSNHHKLTINLYIIKT